MPELPEVETVTRELRRAGIAGLTITKVDVRWPGTLENVSPSRLARRLTGQCLASIGRRGKFLVFGLSGGETLLVHLRMTGQLHITSSTGPHDPHERVILTLADGRQLRFHDTRKFGKWCLLQDPEQKLGRLGPEPLSRAFTPAVFRRRIGARRAMLKPLLLDQGFLAGLGNIYVDEALWWAGLHPRRGSDTLSPAEADRLHGGIRRALSRGIAAAGTTLGHGETNFISPRGRGRHQAGLKVFRRTGKPCPRCGTPVVRMVVSQRGTHVCPACQPEHPAPLSSP